MPQVMQEAVKLMAAICIIPPDGHIHTIEAITIAFEEQSALGSGEINGRFKPIVQGLTVVRNEQLRTNCLTLINAIITSPDDVDFRMHLRNEFLREGLMDLLETLAQDATEELQLQLKVFYENRNDDFNEFIQRFGNIQLEIDNADECFELIKSSVRDTSAEPYFLSLLQHLLLIRDDAQIRPAYFQLIEVCLLFVSTRYQTV